MGMYFLYSSVFLSWTEIQELEADDSNSRNGLASAVEKRAKKRDQGCSAVGRVDRRSFVRTDNAQAIVIKVLRRLRYWKVSFRFRKRRRSPRGNRKIVHSEQLNR